MPYYLDATLDQLIDNVTSQPNDIDVHVALIKRYVAEGQVEDALIQTKLADKSIPGDVEVLVLQALCLCRVGQLDEGTRLLDLIARQNATSEFQDLLVNEIMPLFQQETGGLTPQEQLQKNLDEAPADQKHIYERVKSLTSIQSAFRNDPQLAIELLQEHLRKFPDDLNAEYLLGRSHLNLQQNKQAEKIFRNVLEKDESCSAAVFALALVVDDLHEAILLSRRGLEISQHDHLERYNLGVRLLEDDQPEMARRELSRIPADDATYAFAMCGISESYEREGDISNAIEYQSNASCLCPNDPMMKVRHGQLLIESGFNYEGLEVIELAIEMESGCLDAWLAKADVHKTLGDDQNVFDVSNKTLEIFPNEPTATCNLARVLDTQGETEQALSQLSIALGAHPDNFVLLLIAGAFSFKLKQYEDALEYSLQAMKANDSEYAPYWNAALTYCQFDQREKCLEYLTLAVEKHPDAAEKILSDTDLKRYWNDPDFQALAHVGLTRDSS